MQQGTSRVLGLPASILLAAGILLAAPLSATAESGQVLLENGGVKVTAADFEAFVLLRVPEVHRAEFRASPERVAKTVEAIYSNRILAAEAKRQGLAEDPAVALRLVHAQEEALASLWQARFRESIAAPDMSARAREVYLTDPGRFTEPAKVTGGYLQVSYVGRTADMALAAASEARKLLLSGRSFAEVAAVYDDARSTSAKQWRPSTFSPKDLPKPVEDVVFSLQQVGDVTEPVVHGQAVHIFQLQQKTPARLRTFEEVRAALVADELSKFRGLETDRRVGELKNTDQTKIYEANIMALVREAPARQATPPPVTPARSRRR